PVVGAVVTAHRDRGGEDGRMVPGPWRTSGATPPTAAPPARSSPASTVRPVSAGAGPGRRGPPVGAPRPVASGQRGRGRGAHGRTAALRGGPRRDGDHAPGGARGPREAVRAHPASRPRRPAARRRGAAVTGRPRTRPAGFTGLSVPGFLPEALPAAEVGRGALTGGGAWPPRPRPPRLRWNGGTARGTSASAGPRRGRRGPVGPARRLRPDRALLRPALRRDRRPRAAGLRVRPLLVPDGPGAGPVAPVRDPGPQPRLPAHRQRRPHGFRRGNVRLSTGGLPDAGAGSVGSARTCRSAAPRRPPSR